jgi:hypothetical protein
LDRQERGHLAIVIGSRALPASRIEAHQSLLREWLGKTFNAAVRLLSGLPFRDTQCGFKLLEREPVAPIVRGLSLDGFAFDVELLWQAALAGLRIAEHPVRWSNAPGTSVGLLTDAPRMLLDLLRLCRRLERVRRLPEIAPMLPEGEEAGADAEPELAGVGGRPQGRGEAARGRNQRGRRWFPHRRRRRRGGRR